MVSFVLSVGLTVYRKDTELLSITAAIQATGPSPWELSGKATFKVLGVELKLNFHKVFGERKQTILPATPVRPLLVAQLGKDESWRVALSPNKHDLVKLWEVDPAEGLVISSAGTFTIIQEVAPLKSKLTLFGNQRPTGGSYFEITKVAVGVSQRLVDLADEKAFFAPAQFKEMSDNQKLSTASFQLLNGGVKIKSSEEVKVGPCVKTRCPLRNDPHRWSRPGGGTDLGRKYPLVRSIPTGKLRKPIPAFGPW